MHSRVWLVTCFTLCVTACVQPTTQSPIASKEEIQQEEDIQQRLVDDTAAQGGVRRTWKSKPGMTKQFERVADRIEDAGGEVCRELGLPARDLRCYYYFENTRSKEINAYADGETIFVTLGMQHFVKDDNELAMIMAHELAHNLLGHVDAAKHNAIAGGVVGLLLDGIAASQGIDMNGELTRTGMQAGVLSYSSAFEAEADYVGLYIAVRAGYRISRAPDLWRRLSLEDPEGIYQSASHPSNAERFVVMGKIVNEIKQKQRSRTALLPVMKE